MSGESSKPGKTENLGGVNTGQENEDDNGAGCMTQVKGVSIVL